MKVLIVGAGLIGLASAYFLRRAGYEVTIVDRAAGPGLETSFANGSLLTPSMAEPWNAPGCWRVLLGSIGRSDSPLQLRLGALPSLARWGWGFLRNSKPERFERSALANLRLSLFSLEVLRAMREETGIEYGRAASGSLKLFRDEASLSAAHEWVKGLSREGLSFSRLSPSETVLREPALAPIAARIAGSLYFPGDEIGNAYSFCVGLADYLKSQGVELRYEQEVSTIELAGATVSGMRAAGERLVADRYVVAMGSYTSPLLERAGVHLPVRPAKGYSITFDVPPPIKVAVVDDTLHAAVVPLQGALRVAGTAEFTGYDLTLPQARVRNLLNLVREVLPEVRLDPATARPWTGLRPMSMDGVPIIGPTPIANLFVNTGHGHLGWTMAAGSGKLLADLLAGTSSFTGASSYALSRFA